MTADRRKGAREKLLLGGIVVKVGLSTADRAFLLGFIELARVITGSEEHRLRAPSLDPSSPRVEENA
ncbi:conjugal transfer protein TraD [Rhizobium leguminosarum]|uniref:conjugal transfer protein TraD n=1 Tax=Rhizobium leguminosarum TaxID=384 RepID=UPI003D0871FB